MRVRLPRLLWAVESEVVPVFWVGHEHLHHYLDIGLRENVFPSVIAVAFGYETKTNYKVCPPRHVWKAH